MTGVSRLPLGPWALLGAIALVASTEEFVALRAPDFTPTVAWSWRDSGQRAQTGVPPGAIVCFGDSSAKYALFPPAIRAPIGRPARNLACCGGQAPTAYFLLRRVLSSGVRPSLIVVNYSPDILAAGPRFVIRCYEEFLTPPEYFDLCWNAASPSFAAELGLGMLLPSIRARQEIRANLGTALRGSTDRLGESNRWHASMWDATDGAHSAPWSTPYDGEVSRERLRALMTDSWACQKMHERYLRRFLDLASARGIKVVWLLPPSTPRVQTRRDQMGTDATHTQFILAALRGRSNVAVVDARHSGYGPGCFVDPIHLNGRGSLALSEDLAEALKPVAEPGPDALRWTNLPPFREPSPPLARIYLEHSRAEFALGGSSRRR